MDRDHGISALSEIHIHDMLSIESPPTHLYTPSLNNTSFLSASVPMQEAFRIRNIIIPQGEAVRLCPLSYFIVAVGTYNMIHTGNHDRHASMIIGKCSY